MTRPAKRLIWIDLEMTGLDTDNDTILEIATVVTESNLDVVSEGPNYAIHQDDEILNGMDDWNKKQHSKSGLLDRVRDSRIPMCGNSICQDRRFLARLMPDLEDHFQYRNLDVTSIKIASQLWAPDVARSFSKNSNHLARDDIYDSIYELKHYRSHFLRTED